VSVLISGERSKAGETRINKLCGLYSRVR